jgi:hypothetical protein
MQLARRVGQPSLVAQCARVMGHVSCSTDYGGQAVCLLVWFANGGPCWRTYYVLGQARTRLPVASASEALVSFRSAQL